MLELASARVCVVLNTKARRGADGADLVLASLRHAKVEPLEIVKLTNPALLKETLAKFIAQKPDVILVGGGDGTQGTAAEALKGTSIALGVLPLGTGNSLARELAIPLFPDKAIEALLTYELKSIDLGKIETGGRSIEFTTVATLGITGKIVDNLTRESRAKLGIFAYLPAMAKSLFHIKPIEVRIRANGETHDYMAAQVVISNGKLHAGPFRVTDAAAIDDGLLSAYVVQAQDQKELSKYALYMLLQRHTDLPNVTEIESDEIEVTLKRRGKVIIDGEPVRTLSFKARSLKQVLNVMVPVSAVSNISETVEK